MLINLDIVCPICGRYTSVVVDENDYLDWKGGKLVQDAFWYLDANERELLISGICPHCWDSMFGDEQEEEEEEEDDEYDDYFLEVGFNPYEGAYDYDC